MTRNRKVGIATAGAALALAAAVPATAVASADQDAQSWSRTFEQGNGSLQPWYGVSDMTRTTAAARGGDHALTGKSDGYWGVEEKWPGQHAVTPGERYGFTGWLKADRAQDVTVTAFFGGAGTARVDVVHATGKWARYSGTVTAPEGASTVGLRFEGDRATRFYLDELAASPGSKAKAGKSRAGDDTKADAKTGAKTHSKGDSKAGDSSSSKSKKKSGEPGSAGAKGQVCANPDHTFHGQGSQGLGKYFADANLWHAGGYDISQTMRVCSYHSWWVKVNAGDHQDGAVLSYPNVHKDFHNWSTGHEPRIDSFDSITSEFAHRAPNAGKYNVAYDLWLNGVASKGSTELMIWTEYNSQRPAGSKVGAVKVDGHKWQLWATGDNKYIAFVATDPLTSGKLDLQAFTNHLVDHNRLAGDSTLGQVDYGVEIVSTHGKQARFDVTNFSVHTS